MKKQLAAWCGVAVLALPAFAQTEVIGGAVNNGNLEDTESTIPFDPPGGSISTTLNHSEGGSQSLQIDLTANNAEGQWKGISDNGDGVGIIAEVTENQQVSMSTWVYIPAATKLGDVANAQLILQLEESADGETWNGVAGSWTSLNLRNIARDTWVQFSTPVTPIAEGTTRVRTRANNINTSNTVNGKEAYDDGGDPENKATPADWIVDGYDGFIYLDDFVFLVEDGPEPPPAGVAILDDVNNGNLEADNLGPFGGQDYRSKNTDEAFNHTPGGSQSLFVDLSTAKGNQWKGLANNVDLPVNEGETVTQAAWIYIPASTVIPAEGNTELVFNFAVDTTNYADTAGTRFNLGTAPRDEWVYVSATRAVEAGEETYRTNKWYVQTADNPDGDDWEAFTGGFYIDDFEFTSFPPPALDTIIGGTVNNGDLEAGALNPFTINGGTPSDLQNHTEGGSQSLNVDLTANNSNGQWKGVLPGGVQGAVASDQSTVNITAWVYIPAATTFGTEPYANLNLELRVDPGNLPVAGAPSLNLATADRDVWVKVEALGIPFVGFDDVPYTGVSGISLGNWNLETVDMVGAAGDIPATEATPADWEAAGYSGSFFIDDVVVEVINPQGDDIQITDTRFVEEGFQITFISRVGPVDVWLNDKGTLNLGDFEPIDFGIDPADGPYVDFEASPEDGQGFYLLVPEGEDP